MVEPSSTGSRGRSEVVDSSVVCDICLYADRVGCWPPGHEGTHCRGCHKSWRSLAWAHCTVCHETFRSNGISDLHWVKGRGHVHPTQLPDRLRIDDKHVWHSSSMGTDWWAVKKEDSTTTPEPTNEPSVQALVEELESGTKAMAETRNDDDGDLQYLTPGQAQDTEPVVISDSAVAEETKPSSKRGRKPLYGSDEERHKAKLLSAKRWREALRKRKEARADG